MLRAFEHPAQQCSVGASVHRSLQFRAKLYGKKVSMADTCNIEGEMNAVIDDSDLEISSNAGDKSEIDEGTRKVIRQLVMKSRGRRTKTTYNSTSMVRKRKSTDVGGSSTTLREKINSESKKWSPEEIVRLIELYEERSCLWDVSDSLST